MRIPKWKGILVMGIITVLIFCGISAVFAKEQIMMYFTANVTVNSDRMYLGEIARIEGEGSLIEELKAIDLGPSPLPGSSFSLAREMILSVLTYRGYDLTQIGIMNLEASGVTVQRAYQLLDTELVMQEVYSYIYNQAGNLQGDLQIDLRREIPETRLPLEDYQVVIGSTYSSKIIGSYTLPISVMIGGKEYLRVPVSLDVKLYADVFVATKTIDRLSVLTEDMIDQRWTEVTQLTGDLITSVDQIIGKQANRTIRENTILVTDYLAEPILIKRNDQIVIQVKYGGIVVQATGKALDSGAKGEWIWVENISSGQKVMAQVIEVGLAQVMVN